MDKTARTELHRTFLVEALPEPLTRASAHLQIFDNYITGTRLRIRSLRDPEMREWTYVLQQRTSLSDAESFRIKYAEIYLDAAEHERFEIFEGTEIRKNRYYHYFGGKSVAFDVYLGKLWGLNTARVEFNTEQARQDFEPPAFAVLEITDRDFFLGEKLVHCTFADVQAEVARMMASSAAAMPKQ